MEWTIFGPVIGLPLVGPAVLSVAWTAFWIWMLVDAVLREQSGFPGTYDHRKILWIVAIALMNVVSVGYFLVVFARGARTADEATAVPPTPSQDAA